MPSAVQAVERAMTVLQVFAADPRPLSIDEVAIKAGLPRATAHRLIHTLQSRHYVQPSGKKFRLGHSVLGLGFGRLHAAGLNHSAQPILDALTDQSNETTILSILHHIAAPSPKPDGDTESQSSQSTSSQPADNKRVPSSTRTATPTAAQTTTQGMCAVAAVANPHQTLTVAIERGQQIDPHSGLVAPLLLAPHLDSEGAFIPIVGFYDQNHSVRVIAIEVSPWQSPTRATLSIAAPASRWTESELFDRYADTLIHHAWLLGA